MQRENGMKRSAKSAKTAPEYVQEPMKERPNREKTRVLIPEERIQDLEYVELSGRTYPRVKRLLDVLLSLLALVVLLIPMGIIALAVYLDDPGSVFFSQDRVGLHGRMFRLYKFRSMKRQTPEYRATGELDASEAYITRIGRFLRRSSLDEIPQLFNVLKGDMSLIGPRPLIAEEREIHEMRARFGVYNIRPGLTGLAQIKGRDRMDAAEKIRWDVTYLMRFGFREDLHIFLATIPSVLKQEGVSEGGFAPEQKK